MNMLTREQQQRQRELIDLELERACAELAGSDPVQPPLSHECGPERQSKLLHYFGAGRFSQHARDHILSPQHILAVFDSTQVPECAPTPVPYIVALRMEGFSSATVAFRAAVVIRDMVRTKDVSVMVLVFGGPKRTPDGIERESDVAYRGGHTFDSRLDFTVWLARKYPMPPETSPAEYLQVADQPIPDESEWRRNHDAEHDAVLRGVRRNAMTVE